jgi:hypothetical protein
MKKIKTHWDSYGVFAIAIQLQTHDYGFIDGLWQDAIDLYQRFYYSSYNDANKSELECINEYMADINKQLNKTIYEQDNQHR